MKRTFTGHLANDSSWPTAAIRRYGVITAEGKQGTDHVFLRRLSCEKLAHFTKLVIQPPLQTLREG
jgi:hypothetical protein